MNKKSEIAQWIIKVIIVSAILLTLIVLAGKIAQYQKDNYFDTVYLGNGKIYCSNQHDILIDDGREVIIDGNHYSWMFVDHIQLHQKVNN